MSVSSTRKKLEQLRSRIQQYHIADESELLQELVVKADIGKSARNRVSAKALHLAAHIRDTASQTTGVEDFLAEYSLSTKEGVALMCLAEALLRVPDQQTADRLIRDKLANADWLSHLEDQDSLLVNASTWGLLLSGRLMDMSQEKDFEPVGIAAQLIARSGEPLIRASMKYVMRIMGSQFVLGRDIEEALQEAKKSERTGYRYSYDMLGEAACTMADAERYYESYLLAIAAIGQHVSGTNPVESAGISVKLSALHPRYESEQQERVLTELLPRLKVLALEARKLNIGFTIDAEESERLEISLAVIESLIKDEDLGQWDGLGIAVQAYQKRAFYLLQWLIELCRQSGRKIMVRLVKGAYWDQEIKRSQVEGLQDYPVFTRKAVTDLSYQACAKLLLENARWIFPQFATHNAYTVAFVQETAGSFVGYEFQRLHGMGEELFDYLIGSDAVDCRIYAPVGRHAELLAYLVRRLLENGANASFVNHIYDQTVPLDSLVADPVEKVMGWRGKVDSGIPSPAKIYGNDRLNSKGLDLSVMEYACQIEDSVNNWRQRHGQTRGMTKLDRATRIACPAETAIEFGVLPVTHVEQFEEILTDAGAAFDHWSERSVVERHDCLLRLADKINEQRDKLIAVCVWEAGKTIADAVAEVREAIDFCRYYAAQSLQILDLPQHGKSVPKLRSRGVMLCISPWNFPLAIFLGQVTAALAAGNAVIAKPSEKTGLTAHLLVQLMQSCGFTENLVQLINCTGQQVSHELLPDPRISGVMFTGSTATGASIARRIAQRSGVRIPLIAETGGQNCMLVDSTALPEQVVKDVVTSGFQSAGQRCSALRVLYLQEEIADRVITMIAGAMRELRIGDPARVRTDIGPVIDSDALAALQKHVLYLEKQGRLIYQCRLTEECERGHFFAPRLYEIENISCLAGEVFGPIVHVVRFRSADLHRIFDEINSTGFGLTFAVHSRIQRTAELAADSVQAGNIYVNRNMIGAVVGVQPFGGRGMSGTGPKAGGPFYLWRLLQQHQDGQGQEKTIAISEPDILQDVECQDSLALRNGRQWSKETVERRVERVTEWFEARYAQPFDQYQDLLELVVRLQSEPRVLTGVTGELNELHLEPRGLIFVIAENERHRLSALKQVLVALLAGNQVVRVRLGDGNNRPSEMPELPMLDNRSPVYQEIDLDSWRMLEQFLQTQAMDGVAVAGSIDIVQRLDRLLCKKTGPLVPLITETALPVLLLRLTVEKLVSTDTTASGGNASLLAMGK